MPEETKVLDYLEFRKKAIYQIEALYSSWSQIEPEEQERLQRIYLNPDFVITHEGKNMYNKWGELDG